MKIFKELHLNEHGKPFTQDFKGYRRTINGTLCFVVNYFDLFWSISHCETGMSIVYKALSFKKAIEEAESKLSHPKIEEIIEKARKKAIELGFTLPINK